MSWWCWAESERSVFTSGVSLAISRVRTSLTGWRLFGKYLARGLRILAYGVALTVVFLALGMGVVAFGILHLIGISIILAYPFLRLRFTNLVLGTLIFVVTRDHHGVVLASVNVSVLPYAPECMPSVAAIGCLKPIASGSFVRGPV